MFNISLVLDRYLDTGSDLIISIWGGTGWIGALLVSGEASVSGGELAGRRWNIHVALAEGGIAPVSLRWMTFITEAEPSSEYIQTPFTRERDRERAIFMRPGNTHMQCGSATAISMIMYSAFRHFWNMKSLFLKKKKKRALRTLARETCWGAFSLSLHLCSGFSWLRVHLVDFIRRLT